jgi:excisionase family DNA binding protein
MGADTGHIELQLPQLKTAAEVAAFCRCRVETVYGFVRDGRLRADRVGTRLRFRREHVEAFLAGGDAA